MFTLIIEVNNKCFSYTLCQYELISIDQNVPGYYSRHKQAALVERMVYDIENNYLTRLDGDFGNLHLLNFSFF